MPIIATCTHCEQAVSLPTEGAGVTQFTRVMDQYTGVESSYDKEALKNALMAQLTGIGLQHIKLLIDDSQQAQSVHRSSSAPAPASAQASPHVSRAFVGLLMQAGASLVPTTNAVGVAIFCDRACLENYLLANNVQEASISENIVSATEATGLEQRSLTVRGRAATTIYDYGTYFLKNGTTLQGIIIWESQLNNATLIESLRTKVQENRFSESSRPSSPVSTALKTALQVVSLQMQGSVTPTGSLFHTETMRNARSFTDVRAQSIFPDSLEQSPRLFPTGSPSSRRAFSGINPTEMQPLLLGGSVDNVAHDIEQGSDHGYHLKSRCAQINKQTWLFMIMILTGIATVIWLLLPKREQNILSSCPSLDVYNVTNSRYPSFFDPEIVTSCSTAPQDINVVLQFLEACVNLGWVNASRVTNQAFVEAQNPNGGLMTMLWEGILTCVKTMGPKGLYLYQQIIPPPGQQAAPALVPVQGIIDVIRHYFNMTTTP